MPVFKVKSNHKSAIDNIVFYMQIDSAQMEELSKLTESMPVYCIGISSAEGEDVKEVKSYSEGINIIKSLTLHRKTWLKVGLDCTIIGIREEIYKTIKLSFDNSMKKVIVDEKDKSIKAGTTLFIVINHINRILLNKIFN